MIHSFRARHYGCLVDVDAALTPIHAFVGPNDSGKSTLLNGLRTLVQLAGDGFSFDGGKWAPFEPFLPADHPSYEHSGTELGCAVDGAWYTYVSELRHAVEQIGVGKLGASEPEPRSELRSVFEPSNVVPRGPNHGQWDERLYALREHLAAARLVRFDPDALRKPSGLIPETERVGFFDDRGYGLAGVFFALRNRDDGAFATVVEGVRRHFPTIRNLRVKAVTSSEVVLVAELADGTQVEAKRMSEGLLYYLAFAALQHLDPVSLLLVEEPENGLHPARIAEVMAILREVSKTTQVLMATHSPLVINELLPEEVSVVTRTPAKGTQVRRIHETPDFEARAKVYALGELWLAYANGTDEAPLLEGGPP